jgi:hypothetical protein
MVEVSGTADRLMATCPHIDHAPFAILGKLSLRDAREIETIHSSRFA